MQAPLETTRSYSGACLGLRATLRVQWVILIATSPPKQVRREGNTLNPKTLNPKHSTHGLGRPHTMKGGAYAPSTSTAQAYLPQHSHAEPVLHGSQTPRGGQGFCASKSRHQRPESSGSFFQHKKGLRTSFRALPGLPDLPAFL